MQQFKTQDKAKVARTIADMLGVADAKNMSPTSAVNAGLRSLRSKKLTPDLKRVVSKMLSLADQVGIKYDTSAVPQGLHEAARKNYNIAQDVLRFKDYDKLKKVSQTKDTPDEERSEVGHSLDVDVDDDQLRRRKVKYKLGEEVEELDEDQASADYKTDINGRPYRAHRITFRNSGAKGRLADDPDAEEEGDSKIKEECEEEDCNFSDSELEEFAQEIDDPEDIIDLYDDDELEIVDDETGERIEEKDLEDVLDEGTLAEVLTRSARLKARTRFARTKNKRLRKMRIALSKRSDTKTILRRARRLAIKILKQKILRKPLSQFTISDKERVEKLIARKRPLVNRLTLRLVPKIRRIEHERMKRQKESK